MAPISQHDNNPFSGSSPKMTAATIGGFVGAFVLVLGLATGLFIWFRNKSKRPRESYSRITSMPWDRSPLFMVAPNQSRQHDSYRGISSHHSFPGLAMDITRNVPRLLPPPRPPPPSASRVSVQLRHQSSGLILPPRPELENTQVVEKDSSHLNLQLKGPNTTPMTESRDSLRPERTAPVDDMHYHQHARFTLSPAINRKLIRNSIDDLYPDSPTLALTPVQARYGHKHPGQRPLDSPTSTYSNDEGTENDSGTSRDVSDNKEEESAIYQTAKQVYINSPTSAHTAALPREFHKTTRYLCPDFPSAPRTPSVPKQVHLSTAYLYAADITRPAEEKRNKLRKVKSRVYQVSILSSTPTIPWKDTRRAMHMSTPAVPSQHVLETTSMQNLRPRAVSAVPVEPTITTPAALSKTSKEVPVASMNPLTVRPSMVIFESTTTPLEMLSSATYKGSSSSGHGRRGVRPSTVTFESTTRVPPAIMSRGPRPSPVGVRPRNVTFEPTINNPPRPRTVAFEPTTTAASTVVPNPRRPKSLGPGPTSDFVQETCVVNKIRTKYQYPTSSRLTRRSTSNGTLPPRSRPYPYRSSSLNPNSHIPNQSPTSPINADSKDMQDIRSTKYLSSEFAATHGTRRQAQRAMTASPTIMSRSVQNTLDNSSQMEKFTNTPDVGNVTDKPKSPRQQSSSPTPQTPGTYGTAIVTSTVSYSRSQRRGQHHSIQPPHRLMAPLSRGTNVSPRMGMGLGLGSGWI